MAIKGRGSADAGNREAGLWRLYVGLEGKGPKHSMRARLKLIPAGCIFAIVRGMRLFVPAGIVLPLSIPILLMTGSFAAAVQGPDVAIPGGKLKLIAVADPSLADDRLWVGVDIRLDSGYKTYWRKPGYAGLPPEFDFSGSENVLSARVHWPVPEWFGEGPERSIGYVGDVVFPVEVRRFDKSHPTRLRARIRLGVCELVCIPVTRLLSLDVPAVDQLDVKSQIRLNIFRAMVPRASSTHLAMSWRVMRNKARRPYLEVRARIPASESKPALFMEWPKGVYLPDPVLDRRVRDTVVYKVVLDRLVALMRDEPDALDEGASITMTLAADGSGLERNIALGDVLVRLRSANASR